ncbi:DarT ssDNA thymidine ADP-ribosyltransferase family protein [Paraburkholderia tropica]|uniref:DarT ssDNA thymidine ADP-ribosyltransferase family protein n=1 Tax=Paraburkholderia tropica TaxID=92647 RepID=UPI002AB6C965|nr:DarT ssDNA thymidine ADP-ribosyltransferase family protein [Paraburkholderia tropica]
MRNFVAVRGIRNLLHFTQISNLPSILQHGIVPRRSLEAAQAPFKFNDFYRYDGYLNASCFTIGWPNYKMFYPLRLADPAVKWAVIECRPDILWDKHCIFSATNAASGIARAIGEVQRTGVPGIAAMFAEAPGKPTREQMRLRHDFPTDPQAEVLVCDVVEPAYFVRVHVHDTAERAALAGAYPMVNFDTGWEGYRSDFEHWR